MGGKGGKEEKVEGRVDVDAILPYMYLTVSYPSECAR